MSDGIVVVGGCVLYERRQCGMWMVCWSCLFMHSNHEFSLDNASLLTERESHLFSINMNGIRGRKERMTWSIHEESGMVKGTSDLLFSSLSQSQSSRIQTISGYDRKGRKSRLLHSWFGGHDFIWKWIENRVLDLDPEGIGRRRNTDNALCSWYLLWYGNYQRWNT